MERVTVPCKRVAMEVHVAANSLARKHLQHTISKLSSNSLHYLRPGHAGSAGIQDAVSICRPRLSPFAPA